MDRNNLRSEVERLMRQDTPVEVMRGNAELLFALDTVLADFDFETAIAELYAGELAGFYDPKLRRMVLATDLPEQLEKITLYHELVHALQDQNFDLGRSTEWREDASDELGAWHALLEGDATSTMMDVVGAVQNIAPPPVTPEMLRAEGLLLQAAPRLAHVPGVLKRSLLAPYVDGLGFALALRERGGFAEVDRAHQSPPVSTEQVLHVDKYFSKEPVVPVPAIPVPPGFGASAFRDVMGEQGLRILFEDSMPERLAVLAASDWGGDRIAVFSEGELRVVRWHLVFDTDVAARRAAVAFARGALRPELEVSPPTSEQTVRSFADARAAELAVRAGRLCQVRPQRGAFALVVRGKHLGMTLGPYRRTRTDVRAAGECPQALVWAEQLARGG